MDIKQLRDNIDRIDGELVSLFAERMEITAEIAKYKTENSLPVFDEARELEVLNGVISTVPEHLEGYAITLYKTIFDVSRSYQETLKEQFSA